MEGREAKMVKQRGKLWGLIEEIKECKPSRHGNGVLYHVKLVGVERLVWVHQNNLSKDVHKNYNTDGSVANNAKAYVNRGFVKEQKKFLTVRVF